MPAKWFRDSPYVAWDLMVRVAPGFTMEETRADLTSAMRALPPEAGPLGSIGTNQVIHARSFAADVVGDVRPSLLMLGAGVLLMLIVAGVNVASLLLARGLTRRRELSVRAAIGASRVRLLCQLATEAAVLASFGARMQRLDVGFAAQNLFLAELSMPPSRYAEPADLQRAMVRLAEHAATLPSISHATAVVSQPFAGTQGVDATVFAEGQPFDESANPIVNYEGTDPSYFATLRLPIRRGRGIDGRDRAGSQPVAVVNEAFARLFWPDRDPIGRRLKWGSSTSRSPG